MTTASSPSAVHTLPRATPAVRRRARRPKPATEEQSVLWTYTPAEFWNTTVSCPQCSHAGRAAALWTARHLGEMEYVVMLSPCKHEMTRAAFIALLATSRAAPP